MRGGNIGGASTPHLVSCSFGLVDCAEHPEQPFTVAEPFLRIANTTPNMFPKLTLSPIAIVGLHLKELVVGPAFADNILNKLVLARKSTEGVLKLSVGFDCHKEAALHRFSTHMDKTLAPILTCVLSLAFVGSAHFQPQW
jgi:hypothetical protein